MRRTVIALVGNDLESLEVAGIYLNRRGFERFGGPSSLADGLKRKGKPHGLISSVDNMEELAWLQRDAEEASVKLVAFGIRNADAEAAPPACLAAANSIITYAGHLEHF